MARKSPDDPLSWYGTRTVSRIGPCGFCTTPNTEDKEAGNPHRCMNELPYFDKLWICGCECNADWKPVAVIVEKDGTIAPTPDGIVIQEREERSTRSKKKPEQVAQTEEDSTDDYEDIEVHVVSTDEEPDESEEEEQSSSTED